MLESTDRYVKLTSKSGCRFLGILTFDMGIPAPILDNGIGLVV
jgi:hypothetical protein